MKAELAIRNAQVVTYSGVVKADIGIKNEKIAFITQIGDYKADEIIDAKEKLLLPGIVDSHVHLRQPGFEHKEDFTSGTQAAAAGGVTSVLVMPTTRPPTDCEKAFQEKLSFACEQSVVDFGIQVVATSQNVNSLQSLIELGAISVEIFPAFAPASFLVKGDDVLYQVLKTCAKTKTVVGIYPDHEAFSKLFEKEVKNRGLKGLEAHMLSRPGWLEAFVIWKIGFLAKKVGAPVLFRQVSASSSVKVLRELKKEGNQLISAEVSPHHLTLTWRQMLKAGPYAKVLPPLREEKDLRALWRGIEENILDIVASDHAPHLPSEKNTGWEDIWKAPGGVTGLETILPVMFTQVVAGKLSLERMVSLTSTKPAKLFGIFPTKGTIAVGSDADLILVDPKKKRKIDSSKLYTKAKATPFDGMELYGFPEMVFLRGKLIYKDGQVMGKPGGGKFLRRRRYSCTAGEVE